MCQLCKQYNSGAYTQDTFDPTPLALKKRIPEIRTMRDIDIRVLYSHFKTQKGYDGEEPLADEFWTWLNDA